MEFTVKVKKDDLLAAVSANREQHRKIFLEAQEGYRTQAIKELDAMLVEAREGKRIRRSVSLIEPADHTPDYDRIIHMLKMSQNETIEIDERDYQQYVLDDWGWKRQFLYSNSAYSATATSALDQYEHERNL